MPSSVDMSGRKQQILQELFESKPKELIESGHPKEIRLHHDGFKYHGEGTGGDSLDEEMQETSIKSISKKEMDNKTNYNACKSLEKRESHVIEHSNKSVGPHFKINEVEMTNLLNRLLKCVKFIEGRDCSCLCGKMNDSKSSESTVMEDTSQHSIYCYPDNRDCDDENDTVVKERFACHDEYTEENKIANNLKLMPYEGRKVRSEERKEMMEMKNRKFKTSLHVQSSELHSQQMDSADYQHEKSDMEKRDSPGIYEVLKNAEEEEKSLEKLSLSSATMRGTRKNKPDTGMIVVTKNEKEHANKVKKADFQSTEEKHESEKSEKSYCEVDSMSAGELEERYLKESLNQESLLLEQVKPLSSISCFLPAKEDKIESRSFLQNSLESCDSCKQALQKNMLSVELMIPRIGNGCFQGNILISDFSNGSVELGSDIHPLYISCNKVINRSFCMSLCSLQDGNFLKESITKKCESKSFFDMLKDTECLPSMLLPSYCNHSLEEVTGEKQGQIEVDDNGIESSSVSINDVCRDNGDNELKQPQSGRDSGFGTSSQCSSQDFMDELAEQPESIFASMPETRSDDMEEEMTQEGQGCAEKYLSVGQLRDLQNSGNAQWLTYEEGKYENEETGCDDEEGGSMDEQKRSMEGNEKQILELEAVPERNENSKTEQEGALEFSQWNQDQEEIQKGTCQRKSKKVKDLKNLFQHSSDKGQERRKMSDCKSKKWIHESNKKLCRRPRHGQNFSGNQKGTQSKDTGGKYPKHAGRSRGRQKRKWPHTKQLQADTWTKRKWTQFTLKGHNGGFSSCHTCDPPIKLSSEETKVRHHSGGDAGGQGQAGFSRRSDGSAGGSQGNGGKGSDSGGKGSDNGGKHGGQSGDGDGNRKRNEGNNNNVGGSNISNNLNNRDTNKGNKDKTIRFDKPSTQPLKTRGPPLTPNPTIEPSLPPPALDDETIARRRFVEENRPQDGSTTSESAYATPNSSYSPPGSTYHTSESSHPQGELEESQAAGGGHGAEQTPTQPVVTGDEEEDLSPSHAVMTIEQLCDTLGNNTYGLPSDSEGFRNMNICLINIMHDLAFCTTNEDGSLVSVADCCVCLILSQLLNHLANLGHDGFVSDCQQCAQIFNIMMQHAIICITQGRPRSRLSRSDLCYKICKASEWRVDKLTSSSDRLKGKVRKYCAKVLGNFLETMPKEKAEDGTGQVMGEMGGIPFTEIPSTGLSSTTSKQSGHSLSLNGNIVTTETGDKEAAPPEETPHPPVTGSASGLTRTMAVMPQVSSVAGTVGTVGDDSHSHVKLVRKPSVRKTPAIPPAIVEENQPLDHSASAADLPAPRDDEIAAIFQRRFGQRGDDRYETQRTYGEHNRYESVPVGVAVHDEEQFMSVWTCPKGVPGVGEVVFGHPSQLRKIAGFWDKKREECERTQNCPYMHREEGVILAEQKENFSILRTRYQKHHQWERVTHLGNGMSGKCHLAIDLKTNFKFCCKKIHLLRYAEEELSLWSEMHNAFIVRLYGAIRHGVKVYIFSEFFDGGSLASCIEEQRRLGRRLSHWSAINYFQQMLKVLAYLQSKNILHEDIKADNILLRRNSTHLAVTDFGTSRRLQDPKELKNKSPLGSPTHWSPEKASMEGHGFPSDLWAAVCVLVHMLSGEPPWVKRFLQKAAILNFIIYAKPPPMEDVPDNVQAVVRNLIERGFVKDPQHRPSPSELLRHPAFSILDEGTPETYFSTLVSQTLAAMPGGRLAGAVSESQNHRAEGVATNILPSVPSETTVLFETTVSTGPYQESDNRQENREDKASMRQTERDRQEDPEQVINSSAQARNSREHIGEKQQEKKENLVHNDGKEIQLRNVEGNIGDMQNEEREGPVHNDGKENQVVNVADNDRATSSTLDDQAGGSQTSLSSSGRSRLLAPVNINSLLPDFDELFPSGDSENQQSIKSFFADHYNRPTVLSTPAQTPLQVYKPGEKSGEQVPNLSIFDVSWGEPPQINTEQDEESSPAAPQPGECLVRGPPLLDQPAKTQSPPLTLRKFKEKTNPSKNPVNFNLSSGSDECTSADIFESGPNETLEAARQPSSQPPHLDTSKGRETQAGGENESRRTSSSTIPQSPSDLSEVASTGSNHSSSGQTSLQQRKPINLKLNVSGTPSASPLSHSQSMIQVSSTSSSTALGEQKRHTWSNMQLSHSQGAQHSSVTPKSGSTPSTGRLTSTPRKHSSTSGPNTGSSGTYFMYHLSRPNSVKEEQDKYFQELQGELLTAVSHSSSDSERLSDLIECPQENQKEEETPEEKESDSDMQAALAALQTEIGGLDESLIGGHKLQFHQPGKETFYLRVHEWPVYWKFLIRRVRQRIVLGGHDHFAMFHLDNSPVNFAEQLTAHEFKVQHVEKGRSCWCERCRTMY